MLQHRWILKVKVTQSCLTLCDPMDCSLPGFSLHGILQAKILEWGAVPFSRGSSQPRNQTRVSCIAGAFFTNWAIREDYIKYSLLYKVYFFLDYTFPQNNRNEEQWYKLAAVGIAASTSITQLLNDSVSDKELGNFTECTVWTLLLNEQYVLDALWYLWI